jgi:uncharacterized protein (DUF2147 family)
MLARLSLVFAALTLTAGAAFADPIVGNWKTAAGPTAAIVPCGGNFCITLKSGKFSGKQIGRFKAAGDSYSGTITDPNDDKTYSGTASVTGARLKMTGCALKIFCKTQTWSKL